MALDITQTASQIDALAFRAKGTSGERHSALGRLLRVMEEKGEDEVAARLPAPGERPFMAAAPQERLSARHDPPRPFTDYCVASVDGSHIDVDRHMAARCYLINLGSCVLTYGAQPDARLDSEPCLYSGDDDLFLTVAGPGGNEEVPVEGGLLGIKRAVQEVEGLASLASSLPPELPLLALLDGSLVLWGLSGRGHPPFVRDVMIRYGLVPALDKLRSLADGRPVAVAAYVSLPQSTEVVHTVRTLLCDQNGPSCKETCSMYRSGPEPCSLANGFLDRDLFGAMLALGQRSCVFATSSSISREHYGPHQVYYYYLNAGQELARVEVPQWVAQDRERLDLSHALVLDQCRRGAGYPAAIMEAHEQAVIDGGDREVFRVLVEDALGRQRLPVYTSEKNHSKRVPWV